MRKNLKKLTALTLTVAMSMASAMTAFAAGATDGSGDIGSGTGNYEGGDMQYPAISVTVPTTGSVDVSYIADPNNLISSTKSGDFAANSAYAGCKFEGDTGIYFLKKAATSVQSGDGLYSSTSQVFDITNESAQDVQVTVSLEKTADGSGDVAYSNTGTFATTDKAKKIYLAITDGTSTSALSGDVKATLSKELKGQKDNYEPSYDDMGNNGYEYKLKNSGDANFKAWNKASYNMTGALNKNAKWGDGVGFPDIKVTYSWIQSPTNVAPSIATTSYAMTAGRAVEVTVDFGKGDLGATAISEINYNGKPWVVGKHYTVSGNKITITSATVDYLLGLSTSTSKATVVFDSGDEVEISLTK